MDSDLAIKVSNISKRYTIGAQKDGSLRGTLAGLVKGKSEKNTQEFWALKDVSFEIKRGDVVGIIGRNGAGKSTLLKILSQITKPSSGKIEINGRIASLLEVGTGFHPELTGRENIYLNGTILGMTRKEVKEKFDEIVEFSGVQKFIDTPVKHYSSGMYVRLAFAVAAHLEPEILIIDEVLAVGDAEFQKKCLGKMKEVAGKGRTVLFVSHNLSAVASLCNRGMVMTNGELIFNGPIGKAMSAYNGDKQVFTNSVVLGNNKDFNNDLFELKKISLVDKLFNQSDEDFKENEKFSLLTEIFLKDENSKYHLSFVVKNFNNEILFTMAQNTNLKIGENKLICDITQNFFNVGEYLLSLYIIQDVQKPVLYEENILTFRISEREKELGQWMGIEPGYVKTNFEWRQL